MYEFNLIDGGGEEMDQLSAYGLTLVPVVIALTELLKRLGIPKSYMPIISMVLGLLLSFIYLAPDDPKKAILLGLVLGLSAIGLFSGTKNTVQGIKSRAINKKK